MKIAINCLILSNIVLILEFIQTYLEFCLLLRIVCIHFINFKLYKFYMFYQVKSLPKEVNLITKFYAYSLHNHYQSNSFFWLQKGLYFIPLIVFIAIFYELKQLTNLRLSDSKTLCAFRYQVFRIVLLYFAADQLKRVW